MVNLLQQGFDWLEAQRHEFAASPVTYHRGVDSIALLATVGSSVHAVDNGDGGSEEFESRDYLIRAADLVIGGVVVLPERGDTIHEVAGLATYIHEVMPPVLMDSSTGREPHYRYSDPGRLTLRIHTKLVDREVAP